MPAPEPTALDRLEADGYLHRSGDALYPTKRYRAAMMRAAASLMARRETGDTDDDLRLPIALALMERYGAELGDEEIVELVAAMLPIHVREVFGAPPPER